MSAWLHLALLKGFFESLSFDSIFVLLQVKSDDLSSRWLTGSDGFGIFLGVAALSNSPSPQPDVLVRF